jgi:hypothetical protein
MLKLLIREIDPKEKNGRYLRENLRRIEEYLTNAATGKTIIQPVPQQTPSIFTNSESFETAVNGQTVFNLAYAPTKPDISRMLINGVEMTYGTHFSISSNVVTFNESNAGFSLETSNEFGDPDRITVHYMTE